MPFPLYAVELYGISKCYYSRHRKTEVLKDISLKIPKGKITCIIGPSGSGKTTLLHLLNGHQKEDHGLLVMEKTDLSSLSLSRRIRWCQEHTGFLPAHPVFDEKGSVLDNILLPFSLSRKPWDKKFLNELIQNLRLEELLSLPVCELSTGIRQKTALARALLKNPDIFLADEPTENMDHQSAREVMAMLKKWQRKTQNTVIMVSHDIDLSRHCHALIFMECGKVKFYENMADDFQ